jgi:pilus assembly protein Flp/PilA
MDIGSLIVAVLIIIVITLVIRDGYKLRKFKRKVSEWEREMFEDGQGLVEYALILVLVAVVVIVILALLGPAIGNIFSNIVNAL